MDKASKTRQEKETNTMGEERLNKAVGLFKARLKNQDLDKKGLRQLSQTAYEIVLTLRSASYKNSFLIYLILKGLFYAVFKMLYNLIIMNSSQILVFWFLNSVRFSTDLCKILWL